MHPLTHLRPTVMTGHSLVETFLTVFDRDGLLKLHAAGPITPPPTDGESEARAGVGGGILTQSLEGQPCCSVLCTLLRP